MIICLSFLLFSFTLKAEGERCDLGLYGPNCNLKCSLGCRDKKCKLTSDGTGTCTEGCEPGWYGSQCKIPCQLPENVCRKCPRKCEDGFCQHGSICVSGCLDSYYGTDCFTCEHDCHVCNKHMGRCYNCTDGCPFASCFKESTCHLVKVNYRRNIFLVMLILGSGVGVFVFLTVLVLGSRRVIQLMKRKEHPAELGQILKLDLTEKNDALSTSGNGHYIHAIPCPYDECSEEYFA